MIRRCAKQTLYFIHRPVRMAGVRHDPAAESFMPIQVTCDCGRSFRVKDELAGRKLRCTGCQSVLSVPPAAAPQAAPPQPATPRDVDEEALNILLTETPGAVVSRRAESSRSEAPSRPAGDPASITASRPKPPVPRPVLPTPSKSRPAPKDSEPKWSMPSISVNPSIITGALMMLGAAVWFFAGLAAGFIYFYPPVLFVLGIGAVIRGFKGED